jgi:diguanylate cyclase (GGDEF)-like protein
MQISSKVALSISLVVAIAGTAAMLMAVRTQWDEREREFQQSSKETLQLLALTIAPSIAEGRHHRVQAVLDNVANFRSRYPSVLGIEVLDCKGRVIAALDPRRFNEVVAVGQDQYIQQDLALDEPTTRPLGNDQVLHVIPLKVTHKLGVMRAKLSQEHLTESMRRFRQDAIMLVLATMLFAGIALHLIHRRLVAGRLGTLTKAARALGEGKLRVRASAEGDDEIAELGASFNDMAQSIERYTEDLEHIIDERTEELQDLNQQLEQLAIRDQLTTLYNRRHFDECARRFLEVARRNERPLSVVLVDADHFKSVNDRYGHPVGDKVLQSVSKVLKQNARKADFVARYGGEEFIIVMPEAGLGLAAQGAERMRRALEAHVHRDVEELGGEPVTASFGVATFEKADDRLEDLVAAADHAMYRAKKLGRNRVTVADRSDDGPDEVPTDTKEVRRDGTS